MLINSWEAAHNTRCSECSASPRLWAASDFKFMWIVSSSGKCDQHYARVLEWAQDEPEEKGILLQKYLVMTPNRVVRCGLVEVLCHDSMEELSWPLARARSIALSASFDLTPEESLPVTARQCQQQLLHLGPHHHGVGAGQRCVTM